MRLALALASLLLATCFAQTPPQGAAPSASGLYTVAGHIINRSTGEPLAGALLTLSESRLSTAQVTVISDSAGGFAIPGVPPGKYALVAKHRGFRSQALDQHDAFSTAIIVGPNLDTGHILFRLTPAASISGYIQDSDNEPVNNAQIYLFVRGVHDGSVGDRFAGSTGTNERGRYRFSGLAPGTYFLAVVAQPWYAGGGPPRQMFRPRLLPQSEPPEETPPSPFDVAYPVTYYGGTSLPSTATLITLTTGSAATANVTLEAVPAAHLRLQDSPQPVQMRNVQLFHEGPGGTRMYVNAQQYGNGTGTYIAGMAPGHYEVEIRSFDAQNKSQGAGLQSLDVIGDGVFDPHSVAIGTITGKIADFHSPPGQMVFVQLISNSAFPIQSEPVSEDGAFAFQNSVPKAGRYELSVLGVPNATVDAVSASGAKASGRSVEISGAGSVELTVSLTSGKPSEVVGFVLKDGQPVPGAMVLLVNAGFTRAARIPRDQSDSDGSFTLGAVPPGKYRVIAIDDGDGLEYSNPEVLRPYLAGAQSIVVPHGEIALKVDVQTRTQ